jgi:serine/threonine-protein kinase
MRKVMRKFSGGRATFGREKAKVMPRIRLPRGQWEYSETERLGEPGGFGEVFAGKAAGGAPVAIKRLKLSASEAAHRELDIAATLQGKKLNYVMDVLDAGQDAESDQYFVVMPRAEASLQSHLRANGPMDDKSAAAVLLEIVRGLQEVPQITHRDLKPANVLMHDGRWKIADFGIARFVEDATSTRTLRECLSPPYAAPEQWKLERATTATDIYALGCLGYALLTGKPPFPGPTFSDYHEQHLNAPPPELDGHDPRFQSLLRMMMRKVASARPSLDRVRMILDGSVNRKEGPQAKSSGDLARAAAAGAKRVAQEEAAASAAAHEREQRAALHDEAFHILDGVVRELFAVVSEAAPHARVRGPSGNGEGDVVVPAEHGGEALLSISVTTRAALAKDAFKRSGRDVIAGALIGVKQPADSYVRAASLWYTSIGGAFRWVEMAYYASFGSARLSDCQPYALEPPEADAAAAHLSSNAVAYGPVPIDDENADSFCGRWTTILGMAVAGRLHHPRYLPLKPPYIE